jgi:hypothetical protein
MKANISRIAHLKFAIEGRLNGCISDMKNRGATMIPPRKGMKLVVCSKVVLTMLEKNPRSSRGDPSKLVPRMIWSSLPPPNPL